MEGRTFWIDAARCMGCGVCVDVCPADAITLMDGRASIEEQKCTGCGACADVCPEDAIQPVIQGELVLPLPVGPAAILVCCVASFVAAYRIAKCVKARQAPPAPAS